MTYSLTKYYNVLENGEREICYLIFSENKNDILRGEKLTDYLDEYGLKIMLDIIGLKIGSKLSELKDEDNLYFEIFELIERNS